MFHRLFQRMESDNNMESLEETIFIDISNKKNKNYKKRSITFNVLLLILSALLSAQDKQINIENVVKIKGIDVEERKLKRELNRASCFLPVPALNVNTVPGSVVGYNFYDRITGGGIGERIVNLGDETLMIGTMAAVDSTESTLTRGTYYNYFDGTSWLDTSFIWKRIETVRSGDGTTGVFKTTKSAVICSHTGLKVAINTGPPDNPTWTNYTVPPSTSYPKLAVDDAGGLYYGVYIVAGFNEPLLFNYSLDGALTFNHKYLIDTNSIEWKSGYVSGLGRDLMIAAKNGTIAVINFPYGGNVTLFLSTDNGTTFTTQTLFNAMEQDSMLESVPFDSSFFPTRVYKMLDLWYADGTGDVHIDNSGNVHVAWGTYQLGYRILVNNPGQPIRDSIGELQRIFFVTDWALTGIKYWRTGMNEPITAVIPDASMSDTSLIYYTENGIPISINESLDMGLIGIPSLGTDTSGNVFMVFQGYKGGDVMANDSNFPDHKNPFGHVYVVASTDGTTWTVPKDIYGTSIMGEDVLYPSLADLVDDKLHILVQNDRNPGTWLLQISHPQNKNYFIYTTLQKSDLLTDLKNIEEGINEFKLYHNYPNPFNAGTNILYSLPFAGKAKLEIFNLLGQRVAILIDNGEQAEGNYTITWDGTTMNGMLAASGVYLYRINVTGSEGSFTKTKKMVVIK